MTKNRKPNLPNMAAKSHRDNDIDAKLKGKYHGKSIHIIGCGPSAMMFAGNADEPVIVLNAAAKYWPDADVHLAVENNIWMFDWAVNDPAFRGITVLSVDCARSAPVDAYGSGWWRRVVWTHRANWKKTYSIFERGNGLFRVGGFGGSALCAIHLAMIMGGGGTKVHTWGTEFYFPNGEQHFYGDKPYVKTDDIVSLVDFEIVDGEPVTGAGKYQSTSFFVGCSCAIRKVVKHHGVELIDHSGGLLNPAEMK